MQEEGCVVDEAFISVCLPECLSVYKLALVHIQREASKEPRGFWGAHHNVTASLFLLASVGAPPPWHTQAKVQARQQECG